MWGNESICKGADFSWTGSHDFSDVDISGSLDLTGNLACGSNATIAGDITIDGVIKVDGTATEFGGGAGTALFFDPTAQTGATDSTTGAVHFPNVLKLKWGCATNVANNASVDISFATSFPTACFQAFASYVAANQAEAVAVIGVSKTGIFVNNGGTLASDIRWFAIGR
jgi:hypothetical protein